MNERWDHSQEIRSRTEKARAAFSKMRNLFTSHHITLHTKIRLLRSYVFSILFFGVEAWTLTEATTKKLEAYTVEPWADHVTDDEVLSRRGKETEVVNTGKARKLQYLGHTMRNENRFHLLQTILQGKVPTRKTQCG